MQDLAVQQTAHGDSIQQVRWRHLLLLAPLTRSIHTCVLHDLELRHERPGNPCGAWPDFANSILSCLTRDALQVIVLKHGSCNAQLSSRKRYTSGFIHSVHIGANVQMTVTKCLLHASHVFSIISGIMTRCHTPRGTI